MKKSVLLSIAALGAFLPNLGAVLYDVSFIKNTGPQWAGVVDTTADTLTINSWVEGAGSTQFWTPSTLPLTFKAYEAASFPASFSSLSLFDVPDDWDGTIGANWGFLSDLKKTEIAWNEGTFTDNQSRLGWGIAQFNGGSIDPLFGTEQSFSFVPTSATGNSTVLADSVVVVRRAAANVPDAGGSFLSFALAIGALSLVRGTTKGNVTR